MKQLYATHSSRPLDWHRECLSNSEVSLARERETLERQRLLVHRLQDAVELRKRQLSEAERRGLTEFDPERFLKSRTK
jgi:hypothetical protein